MSLESKISKNVFQGNGTTKTFSFTFRVWKEDQVLVYVGIGDETETDVTSSCSITLSENGGTVTFAAAPAAGTTIAVVRNMPFIQEDQYITGARFDPHEIEDRLDQDCAERQQLLDGVGRAVKVPNTSDKTPEQFVQQLFTARDEAQEAASAAQAAQTAAESCRDEACECASEAAETLENAVTVIQQQEQESVSAVQAEGDTQAKRLEDIASKIIIQAATFNTKVRVTLNADIEENSLYTLPESLSYLVGRSQLFISGNGVFFYEGSQYNEVGDVGSVSTQVKFLQPLKSGDEVLFILLSNQVMVVTSQNSGLVNDADGYLKVNVDGQTLLINAAGQVYVPVMVGATEKTDGKPGFVPAPTMDQVDKPLSGRGGFVDWLACSITGSSQYLRKDDDSKISYDDIFAKFLQVVGGTINGNLILNGLLKFNNGLIQSIISGDKEFSIVASSGETTGGLLSLRPLDSTENAGGFYLGAVNTQIAKYLRGDTSGSLTWEGNRVITGEDCVVISQKANGFTLPAGGTWVYLFVTVVPGATSDVDAGAGQNAGGTYIQTKTNGYVHVFCVRIV